MKKGVDSPPASHGSFYSPEGLVRVLKKYPVRILGVCGLLTLSLPSVRENVKHAGKEVINSADEHWRRAFHPGYRGNGQSGSDDAIYYRDAVKAGYIDPQD